MNKKVRNGIYTTGKESFKVSIEEKTVDIDAIDAIPFLRLKSGQSTRINKASFESFLSEELRHYFWLKE
jgi:hypothetical protein